MLAFMLLFLLNSYQCSEIFVLSCWLNWKLLLQTELISVRLKFEEHLKFCRCSGQMRAVLTSGMLPEGENTAINANQIKKIQNSTVNMLYFKCILKACMFSKCITYSWLYFSFWAAIFSMTAHIAMTLLPAVVLSLEIALLWRQKKCYICFLSV